MPPMPHWTFWHSCIDSLLSAIDYNMHLLHLLLCLHLSSSKPDMKTFWSGQWQSYLLLFIEVVVILILVVERFNPACASCVVLEAAGIPGAVQGKGRMVLEHFLLLHQFFEGKFSRIWVGALYLGDFYVIHSVKGGGIEGEGQSGSVTGVGPNVNIHYTKRKVGARMSIKEE